MPVPETSANVDYRLRLGDCYVRLTRIALVTHSEPPAAGEQASAHENLRQGVLASDLRHQPAALLCGLGVHITKNFLFRRFSY